MTSLDADLSNKNVLASYVAIFASGVALGGAALQGVDRRSSLASVAFGICATSLVFLALHVRNASKPPPPPADTLEVKEEKVAKPGAGRCIGFDFDCTLTVRHFYKVMAWGYVSGAERHGDCKEFFKWCANHNIRPGFHLPQHFDDADPMVMAVEHFCRNNSEELFGEMFREIFLGGEERIQMMTTWLQKNHDDGVEFAIITAGSATAVLSALNAVPEWLPFFPSNRVWDVSQGRHSFNGVMDRKAVILRDVFHFTKKDILLVDDSYAKEPLPSWLKRVVRVKPFSGDLPYESGGLNEASLAALEGDIGLDNAEC